MGITDLFKAAPPPSLSNYAHGIASQQDTLLQQQLMNNRYATQMSMLGGGGGAIGPAVYTSTTNTIGAAEAAKQDARYRSTSIHLRETSNGTIITIGDVIRICPTDGELMNEIAAAYTEHKLRG